MNSRRQALALAGALTATVLTDRGRGRRLLPPPHRQHGSAPGRPRRGARAGSGSGRALG